MLYCYECGKPNELMSNFCSKCGHPFVSLGKSSAPKIKPKILPKQAEREENDDDDEDLEGEDVIITAVPHIEKLEYEIEKPEPRKTTIADLQAAGNADPRPDPGPTGKPVKLTARQSKLVMQKTLQEYKKEAGTLRPK